MKTKSFRDADDELAVSTRTAPTQAHLIIHSQNPVSPLLPLVRSTFVQLLGKFFGVGGDVGGTQVLRG